MADDISKDLLAMTDEERVALRREIGDRAFHHRFVQAMRDRRGQPMGGIGQPAHQRSMTPAEIANLTPAQRKEMRTRAADALVAAQRAAKGRR